MKNEETNGNFIKPHECYEHKSLKVFKGCKLEKVKQASSNKDFSKVDFQTLCFHFENVATILPPTVIISAFRSQQPPPPPYPPYP